MLQVFLPFTTDAHGRTSYAQVQAGRFLLGLGAEET
jgi:hypothetical protein